MAAPWTSAAATKEINAPEEPHPADEVSRILATRARRQRNFGQDSFNLQHACNRQQSSATDPGCAHRGASYGWT
jgi:hypothetical protein